MSDNPQEFIVLGEKKRSLCRLGAWFQRVAGALLFAGFLLALGVAATLILSI